MIFTKKDVRIIGVLLAVLLMLICDGLLIACPPPDCPPCYAWNGTSCVYRCGHDMCCNGSCCHGDCCYGVCYNNETKYCCGPGEICNNNESCCDRKTCYNPNEKHCCYYENGKLCNNNQTCCQGTHGQTCCDNECEFCCDGKCCDHTNCEICKNDTCIRAVPTNMRQTAVVDLGYGILRFEYRWDSTTGDLDDLGNCTVGEKVDYPEGSPYYYWPSPPWVESSLNPSITDEPAVVGRAVDTHYHGSFTIQYQNAGFAANQIYRYHCGPSCCMEEGEYETLLDVGPILRWVTGQDGLWRYSIIKSGAYAEYFPLP